MRKVLVALALMLSMTVTADAGSLKFKAKVTAYTPTGEKVDELVLDCPNTTGSFGMCQFALSVPFEGKPWEMGMLVNERSPGILTAEVVGDARPANSWERPFGKDTLENRSGSMVEIDVRWTDNRIQGGWSEQQVTVARFKVEVL